MRLLSIHRWSATGRIMKVGWRPVEKMQHAQTVLPVDGGCWNLTDQRLDSHIDVNVRKLKKAVEMVGI